MANKKSEKAAPPAATEIALVAPAAMKGPFQVGTADDPREVDADGRITLDRDKDADLIAQLMDPRIGFTEAA